MSEARFRNAMTIGAFLGAIGAAFPACNSQGYYVDKTLATQGGTPAGLSGGAANGSQDFRTGGNTSSEHGGAPSGSGSDGGGGGGGSDSNWGGTNDGGASPSKTDGSGGVATGGAVNVGGTNSSGTALDPDLVLWYKFDDLSGTTVTDASGNGYTGSLVSIGTGTSSFTAMHQVGTGSLNLTSSSATDGSYVALPTNLQAMGATTAITICGWVFLKSTQGWARLFDFGSGETSSYLFLTVQQETAPPYLPRFAIASSGVFSEQVIDATTSAALSTQTWHHFAVVLTATTTYTGTLYLDNVAVGTNAEMTLHPSDLGASTNNWLGRSQFVSADPLLNAYLDDFRVYKRALTAGEIAAVYAYR